MEEAKRGHTGAATRPLHQHRLTPRTSGLARSTMSASSGKPAPTLTQEILSHLGLASKTAAWGTLGVLRTFLSFSVDKDVQRLLRAIAGQGEPRPSALGEPANGRS
nr:annexin A9 [Oryctolagus cuniculus]